MYNENSTYMLLRKFQREKTLGEMLAAVIKTINNLIQTAWLRMRAPDWGQSQSQLMLKRGTMLDVFARCPKKKIAQACTLLK
jgi:hypothetical protein